MSCSICFVADESSLNKMNAAKWLVALAFFSFNKGNETSKKPQERPHCQAGFYCPPEASNPVPCPEGTYGPHLGAASMDKCLECPPEHYCPRAALALPLPCGPSAQQPLSGQDTCECLGEGLSFQVSDAQCQCTLGYKPSDNKERCVLKLYEACRDGRTRTQYGDCLDRNQWAVHCQHQVCLSAEGSGGYDTELGLCLCREPEGRTSCGSLCRSRAADELKLQCQSNMQLELVWRHDNQVSYISGRVLESLFLHWDAAGTLLCDQQLNISRPVYIVQTTEEGFVGFLSGLPEELDHLFPITTQQETERFLENVKREGSQIENTSHGEGEINFTSSKDNWSQLVEIDRRPRGILGPTACLQLGDVLLFTVSVTHHPVYDVDHLYNTNDDFDWGAFRQLKEELTLSWTPPSLFSVAFNRPGVYVLKLSSNEHRHMYIRVMPADGQCYEPGPFFSTIPRHLNRVGISQRRSLLLRPDWSVTGGLVFGAVVILCLCVTILILFREYGWPDKKPIVPSYRLMHLAYNMDDYSSKGSRVISLKKTHRNQQARLTLTSTAQEAESVEEFWDYEHQVDLEAFSSSTFYSLLLKQSLSVTTRLGQLTSEVKELYQGVNMKLGLLQPCLMTKELLRDNQETLKREVDREVVRRKSLGAQLRSLLNNQLQVLKREQQAQSRVYKTFTAHLRECTRLLSVLYSNPQHICEQSVVSRLTSMVDRMGETLSAECQRQGAWGLLGDGAGAKLLCPENGTVLTKEHIFSPDGTLLVNQAVLYDSVTGLLKPQPHCHMLLNSGHTMAVPPHFFVHPQTGRVMPIAGNVAYDPATSTLVCTVDSCTEGLKLETPLLPFIPYPTYQHSGQPLSQIRLQGLRPGQRLQLGAPMADPDTGVPVPILGVTIHPDTGLVYPLGGLSMCPLIRLLQPIQIGAPMLEHRSGNLVLTVGVSLDSVTGAVLPVGGVLLSDFFVEPLSGRMLRAGGASVRAGQLVPHGGGHQTLLDNKVLEEMLKALELLRALMDECGPDPAPLSLRLSGGRERGSGRSEHLPAVAKDLQQAWKGSLHCQLQLQNRLEMLSDWAATVEGDGGACAEMSLPGSRGRVAALVGVEYPDPGGSGLNVPVLGYQTEPVSGIRLPLAGTMEDAEGKGLEAIRYGCQSVDPVLGIVAPVVGARLDISKKTVVPLTASYWLTMAEHSDSVQKEGLQREVFARNTYWQQQRLKEEDILSDLDSSLARRLCSVTETRCCQWSMRPLREAAQEMQELSQAEAQRRAAQCSQLALILPPHVTNILTRGNEEEWHQQRAWQSQLMSGLEKLEGCIEQLQQEQERVIAHDDEWTASQAVETSLREVWEQCCAEQAELGAAVHSLHAARLLSQLSADTAQGVLNGRFWFREYGLRQFCEPAAAVDVMGLLREKALPLLEKLNLLLQEKQYSGLSGHKASDLSAKQVYEMDLASRVWTESVPVVANSTQSLREPVKTHSQDTGLEMSSAPTHRSQRLALSSGLQSQESHTTKEAPAENISIPLIAEEEWSGLLGRSPLFLKLKGVELQMKALAREARVGGVPCGTAVTFVDPLDAQWECEGELVPLCTSSLNPREYLVYQHGLFLMKTLHSLQLTPVVALHITSSLPANNYVNNAFRNSFFYQEAEETLFVRRQRLQSVGGFSLLLLHCLCHMRLKDMSSDASPAFQRLFFKVLQAALGELFQARLCAHPSGMHKKLHSGNINGTLWDSHASSLVHSPGRGLLSQDEVRELERRHQETSDFTRLEDQLKLQASFKTD